MIRITRTILIDESELEFRFVHASGPGGQNVNKLATACQLRLDVARCSALPPVVKERLRRLAGRRMTAGGELLIDARRYRTQGSNRRDALERLVAILRRSAQPEKPRRKTRPTVASRQRRRESKLHRSRSKQLRTSPPASSE